MLPVLSLIFEINTCKPSFKLLYSRQSGFRSNHSCQTALIKSIDEWLSAINNNEIVGTLFIDLSKAFDLIKYDNL